MNNHSQFLKEDRLSIYAVYLLFAFTILSVFLISKSQINSYADQSGDIVIASGLSQLNINQFSSILEDPDHTISIEDMAELDSQFKPIDDNVLNLVYSKKQHWIKFSVDFSNTDEGTQFYLSQLFPFTYDIALYSPTPNGYRKKHICLLKAWDEKVYHSNLLNFDLVPGPESISTYYLSINNGPGLPLQLALNITNRAEFFKLAQSSVMFDGFFYGTAIAFLIYSFLLLLRIRDRSYMLYCGYLLFAIIGFSVYDNYITRYFEFSLHQYYFLIVFPNLQFNLAMRHALIMTNSKINFPKPHRFFIILLNFHTLCTPFIGLLEPRYSFIIVFFFFATYLGFFTVYMFFSYEKLKLAQLRLFVIGWSLPLVFGVVFGASWFEYFIDPLFSFKLIKIGIAWQAIFASLSIAEQINNSKAQVENIEKEKALAEKTAQVKSEFLANMSHELRDPMNRVIGYSSQALSEASPIEKDKYLIKVAENSSYLLNTINNILDFSKMDYGRFQLKNEVFRIADIRQRLIQYFPASDKAINFTIEDKTTSCYLLGDPHNLFRILVNLIGNAFKFTQQGFISIVVNEETHLPSKGDGSIIFSFKVSDSGIGIDSKRIERLFLPFEQADVSSTRQYEGTGLGLSISSSLVKLMKGTITARSKPGQGSTFTVTLPFSISTSETSEYEINANIVLSQDTEVIPEQSRILLVDDSELNIEFMTNYLTNKVTLIDSARNGIEAICKVLLNDYDVILMDVQMPIMDGYEATEQIRKLGYEQLSIIALSAATTELDEHQSRSSGMNDFINKPVNFVELHKKINHWIQHFQSEPHHNSTKKSDKIQISHLDKVFESSIKRDEFVANSYQSLVQLINRIEISNNNNDDAAVQRLAHEAISITGNIGFSRYGALLEFISHHLPQLSEEDKNSIVYLLREIPETLEATQEFKKPSFRKPTN
ncbi:MAG: response regulator [Pseudomonadales bacterium]|nr:response regulator [Pseudomonadales bacterium]